MATEFFVKLWQNHIIQLGVWQTVYMTLLTTLFAYIIGLPLGVVLWVTDKDGLRPRADGSAEAEGVSPSDLRVGAPVVDAAEAERREAAERANEIKALTKLVIVGVGWRTRGCRPFSSRR